MATRVWTDNSGTPINAANLNGMEADIVAAAFAPDRSVPAAGDLNTWLEPGVSRISTPDSGTIANMPPGTRVASDLINFTTGPAGDAVLSQQLNESGADGRQLWRPKYTTPGNFGPWSYVGCSAVAVTDWHVFLGAGQSNGSGRAVVSTATGGKYVQNRIFQFGFHHWAHEIATVPLDMHDSSVDAGLSPFTVFANNYLKTQPDNVGVVIVGAAHGGTGFTTSTTVETWTPNIATNPLYDLPKNAVDQTKAALVAAKATGASAVLKGILWHQGENNSSMSRASYETNLDALIAYFRASTQLNDSKLPFIVGQMCPEGIAANPGRENIDAAHKATPNRVPYTGFAAATLNGYNPGDTTHMSKFGVDYLGRTYLEAFLKADWTTPRVDGRVLTNVAQDFHAIDETGTHLMLVFPTNWAAQNMPVNVRGSLRVQMLNSANRLLEYDTYELVPRKFQQNLVSGVWGAWKDMTPAAAAASPLATPPGSGLKTVPLQLTLGSASQTDGALTGTYRYPMKWNAPLQRVRVNIQNIHPSTGTVKTGAVDFTGLWIGKHAGAGAFTASPTQVQGAFSTPADGSKWTSQWFWLNQTAGVEDMLSLGYTASAGTVFQIGGAGYSHADPTKANLTTVSGIASAGSMPFYIWLEAETYATTPHIAVFGDSLSSGVGSGGVFTSMLSQYCWGKKALPTHYSNSGDTMQSWASDFASFKWTVFDGLAKPDALIWAMGSNDCFADTITLAQAQGYYNSLYPQMALRVSPNIYLANITPRTSVTGANETKRRSYNTWLTGLPMGARDMFNFRDAVSADDETLMGAYDVDGVHLNAAGYAAQAAAITRAVTSPPVAFAP